MHSRNKLVTKLAIRWLKNYLNRWYRRPSTKSLKNRNDPFPCRCLPIVVKDANARISFYRPYFIYSNLKQFLAMGCVSINKISSCQRHKAVHSRFSVPSVVKLNLQIVVTKFHCFGLLLRSQRFPLSPNGGEGWGEGEFFALSARIAKIASKTASVSCKTWLFQNLKTR